MRLSRGKSFLAVLMSVILALSGCGTSTPVTSDAGQSDADAAGTDSVAVDDVPSFHGLDDQDLHQYIQDSVYGELEEELGEDYVIDSVQATYVSNEYLEELSYNSQENIYFGYSLSNLENRFQGAKYVFSLDADGNTTVHEFEGNADDTFSEVTRNVAVGTGVILVCATVSVATAGVAPTVSIVFAASATSATTMALSGAALGGAASAIVTGIQTGNAEEALKAAAVSGSEGFKWGAISGAIAGGLSEAGNLYYASSTTSIPTPRQAELNAFERYPGREQVTYMAGQEVPYGTPGATRPDIIRPVRGHLEAVEVKNYNLESPSSLNELKHVLKQQVSSRVENLPEGSTQRIVLNAQGRGYSTEYIDGVVKQLQQYLADIYPNIPIDVMV